MLRQYPDWASWDYVEPQSRAQASFEYHQFGNGILYAARFPDGTIKIGHTKQIAQRLTHLISDGGGRPEVLAIKAGTFEEEQAIHDMLAAHCRRGREWYNPDPEVLAVVNEWRAELRRDPLAS